MATDSVMGFAQYMYINLIKCWGNSLICMHAVTCIYNYYVLHLIDIDNFCQTTPNMLAPGLLMHGNTARMSAPVTKMPQSCKID